jgi:predicted ATP-dependent serine protease
MTEYWVCLVCGAETANPRGGCDYCGEFMFDGPHERPTETEEGT